MVFGDVERAEELSIGDAMTRAGQGATKRLAQGVATTTEDNDRCSTNTQETQISSDWSQVEVNGGVRG